MDKLLNNEEQIKNNLKSLYWKHYQMKEEVAEKKIQFILKEFKEL